jgi:hypothetical protein
MRLYRLVAATMVVASVLFGLPGCGGGDLVFPGMFLPTPTAAPTATCVASGGTCTLNSDCCSGSCISPNGVNLQCQ